MSWSGAGSPTWLTATPRPVTCRAHAGRCRNINILDCNVKSDFGCGCNFASISIDHCPIKCNNLAYNCMKQWQCNTSILPAYSIYNTNLVDLRSTSILIICPSLSVATGHGPLPMWIWSWKRVRNQGRSYTSRGQCGLAAVGQWAGLGSTSSGAGHTWDTRGACGT